MPTWDPLNGEEMVARLATVYEAVGPRLGCCLVEAHVLLLLAGLRAQTDLLLYEPGAGDEAAVEQMNRVSEGVRVRISTEETQHPNGRSIRVLILESLAGYQYVSARTQMRGLSPFDPMSGWEGLEVWGKAAFDALKATYEPEPVLLDRWIGLCLGYPDRAVEDACEAITQDRSFATLARADIPAVERYGGARPIFSFAPEHADDPEIVATCARWQELLEGVYASEWHQQLSADPAFQAARQARRPHPEREHLPRVPAVLQQEPPLRQERLAYLIHEQTAAIDALERQLITRATIRRTLRLLAMQELRVGQAIDSLTETAEHSDDPEQQAACQQAIAALRQMQAEEP